MDFLRSLKLVRDPEKNDSPEGLGAIENQLHDLVDVFPGPAFVVNAALDILMHNRDSDPLLEQFRHRQEGQLAQSIIDVLQTKIPAHQTFTFGEKEELEVIDLTLFPLEHQDGLLLATGKNVTLQRNLTNALVTSRQLFKDLVTCTAEFVWETDTAGKFRYVSPRGAIGFSAAELDGRIARKLIVIPDSANRDHSLQDKAEDRINPFESKVALEDQIVWLHDKSEGLACMRISAIPIFDAAGNWTGCRGAGHDITEEVTQRAHLDRLAFQEEMLSQIIDAIRQEIDPARLFEIAAKGACEALNSTRIWLGRRNASGTLEIAFKSGVEDSIETELLSWFANSGDAPLAETRLLELAEGGNRIYVSPIFSSDQIDGVIALVRRQDAPDLEESEKRLLRLISDHLGVALIQINAREKLEQLSRTDELSGLLNRRAFHEDVVKRIEHGKRTQTSSALFYIDLDNFKPVNDRFGHEKGDEVLIGVSRTLEYKTRIGDMVARLGGDEFAMWLEDISEEMAIKKARDMQDQCKALSIELGVVDPSLSFSIGIAMTSGDRNESLEGLLAEADAAMYTVKECGKGSYKVSSRETETVGTKENVK